MLVQILGTGCPKCKQLAENTAEAIRRSGLDCRMEKVTELSEIAAFGIISTPGLVIEGQVASAGKLLEPEAIQELLRAAAQNGASPSSPGASAGDGLERPCGCCAGAKAEKPECNFAGAAGGSSEQKNSPAKTAILVVVALVVLALLVYKSQQGTSDNRPAFQPYALNPEGQRLPRMLEFGSTTCVPCKLMEPVLHALQTKHKDKLSTEFYDVEIRGEIARSFQIGMIPTQVFLDPDGKELFRHSGFFPEEEIVKKWAELGYRF